MSEDVSLEVKAGSVVWFSPERGYPEWPGKVVEIHSGTAVVESFGDEMTYDREVEKLIPFTTESSSFVEHGKKRLKRKSDTFKLFMSSIKEAVGHLKEDDPQFSLSLEDSLDTSIASPTLDNIPTTLVDSPQSNRPTPKPSGTSARRSPRNRQRNGLSASMDSVRTDPLAYSPSPLSRKRPAPISPTQSMKRACGTATSPESQSRSRSRGRKKGASRRRLDCRETDSDTTAPADILAQSSDLHLNQASHDTQSTSGMGLVAPGEDLNGSQASIGGGDLASTFALLPSSTPVAAQSVGCTAAAISGTSLSRDASELACTSNASSRSTPSLVLPMASPCASSEDDELPAFDTGAKDGSSSKTYIPAENELVWVKFGRYPFWPALVCSLQKRRKKRMVVNVFFLGYDDYSPVGIKTLRNIRRYDSTNNRIYMLEAHKSSEGLKEQILQAAHEADQIMHLRLEKEIRGSPWEQFREIVKRRPKPRGQVSFLSSPTALPQENQPISTTDHQPRTPGVAHYRSDPCDQGEEAQDSSSGETGSEHDDEQIEKEQEGSSSLYTFEKLHGYISSIKLTLQRISCGQEQSDLHDIFHHGKRKEQTSLRLLEKFGPAQNMPDSKKADLLHLLEQLTEPVTGRKNNFGYAYDVLLPEAIARSIANFEGCSLSAAWSKLEKYQ